MDEQELKSYENEMVKITQMSIVVDSAETYAAASQRIFELDALAKKIENYWEEPIRQAYAAHKSLTQKRNEMLNPLQERRKRITIEINNYLTHREYLRQEAQRIADEQRRRQENSEREKLERAANRAEVRGNLDRADALRDQADAVYVPPVVVDSETKIDGVSKRGDVEIRITSIPEILQQVISGVLPESVVTINETKLKQFIKLSQLKHLGGVEIREVVKSSFRGK